ncbi:Predicted transglutaminase-like cysteine proteinase [Rhizobium sp. RU20A]|uniref:transglutaminase-like cysteine peptidase n=1 Tax=Rhizobium sp. RU20A TaxID=1907412 RepID=UPI000954FF0C|nr:transglutaminase-like cysteine peptidase [Rhizobium sp. RU20A]SIQ12634.1 Predicted transglutaminase-like cysteine proteinase [Rhizobium sp. RU20A]
MPRPLANTVLMGLLTSMLATGSASATPANMQIIGATNPPVGHYEFCRANPSECRSNGRDPGPAILTKESWRRILEVNYDVNEKIQPMTDMEIYGVEEHWDYPTAVGDCEDYALLKRRELIAAGFSPANLLITVVLQPNGDGHAVLTVRTDRGDFVLDNMRTKVLLWSDTEYTFLKRQSSDNAGRWMKIEDGRTPVVGSVR